jgi:hypothetical protein
MTSILVRFTLGGKIKKKAPAAKEESLNGREKSSFFFLSPGERGKARKYARSVVVDHVAVPQYHGVEPSAPPLAARGDTKLGADRLQMLANILYISIFHIQFCAPYFVHPRQNHPTPPFKKKKKKNKTEIQKNAR